MAKRLQKGDVLEISGLGGLVFVCYLGKHSEYGDAVQVCPVEQSDRPKDFDGLFRSGYVTFYPATAAVSQGLARVAGQTECPSVPMSLRRAGARSGTTVKNWIVEDGTRESLKERLSSDELRLPIAAIWNHALLLERVRDGWRPEREGAA